MRSMCGSTVAQQLQLTPTKRHYRVRGIGNNRAYETDALDLTLNGLTGSSRLLVVDMSDLPLLLGIHDIRRLFSTTTQCPLCRLILQLDKTHATTSNCICTQVTGTTGGRDFVHVSQPTEVVSQTAEQLSKVEQIQSALNCIEQQCKDTLTRPQCSQLQHVFLKYQTTWLRPRGGQCRIGKAQIIYQR
eukprot:GHVQ01029403.1.p1 GENE.GHVQ01029403.1~~GHVQ01029403.1.p1  ORF type:complete len:188 (-),score=7.00 GHVQ01029403.1:400-963(-)